MSAGTLFLWVVVPYVSMTVCVVGHIWRYRRDQYTWTTRSTQLLERRMLFWGSNLFHFGALAAIGGHVLGLVVPESLTADLGVSEDLYHGVSAGAGTGAGAACIAGLVILGYRRLANARVAATTTRTDVAVYVLLLLMIGLGMGETVGVNVLGGGYDYRASVALWFRGLFTFDPHANLMASAPLVYQLHALGAWLLVAIWPFSRLVHAWSIPLTYLTPVNILYRSRNGPRRWRTATRTTGRARQ
jgi:nitrate reductase gamma subunit